jgi:hypothetical protein
LIQRKLDSLTFMACELSAPTADVMGAGRLLRSFPDSAVDIDLQRALQPNFLAELEKTLRILMVETPADAEAKSTKAGQQQNETRDSIQPIYVTGLLMAILHANGKTSDTIRFRKNTRDDAVWDHVELPWRRSAFWLLLRISLQSCLALPDDQVQRGTTYKAFMVFFMSQILKRAMDSAMAGEKIFMMMAKIVHRLTKLNPPEDAPWFMSVRDTVQAAHELLNQRWSQLQQMPRLSIVENKLLVPEAFQEGLRLRVPSLKAYLEDRLQSRGKNLPRTRFSPPPRSRIDRNMPELPAGVYDLDDATIWLADVEFWVAKHLDSWVATTLASHRGLFPLSASVFPQLSAFTNHYRSAATTKYADRPELFSVMILTVFELWCALDKLVRSGCALLDDYGPGFSPELLEPLLLQTRLQIERAHRVQHYLRNRIQTAKYSGLQMLKSFGLVDSFGVRFYNQSAEHKILHSRIEDSARSHKREKEEELERKKREYRKLMDSANAAAHASGCQATGKKKQSDKCVKCRQTLTAQNLTIDPYELPLPSAQPVAKAVVFELMVPSAIEEWRDTTLQLLELLSPDLPAEGQKARFQFHDVQSLRSFVSTQERRYQLRSYAKPFGRSHYKHSSVANLNNSDVCRPHGPIYEPFDTKRWLWPSEDALNIRYCCMFELPPGPYRPLQDALLWTAHTSNLAIAQSHSTSLDSHEAYEYVAFRAGHRLQLLNLARQLASPVLRLNQEEVRLLVMQTLWQMGPSSVDDVGEAHILLKDEMFGNQLLSVLGDSLQQHRENWQNCTAMRIFSAVARRLLSLAAAPKVKSRAREFLDDLRGVLIEWMRHHVRSRNEARLKTSRHAHSLRALDIALICYETFDVDYDQFDAVFAIPANITASVECAIQIHDLAPTDVGELSTSTQHLLTAFSRLAVAMEIALRAAILRVPSAMDTAIQNIWNGYRPALWYYEESWLISNASTQTDTCIVHLDMLTGCLMVNGRPLGRLPMEYQNHKTYARILDSVSIHFGNFETSLTIIVHNRCRAFRDVRHVLQIPQLHEELSGMSSPHLGRNVANRSDTLWFAWRRTDHSCRVRPEGL